MVEGYGFGVEGDWKIVVLFRVMKIMVNGKGIGLMEDYIYNFDFDNGLIFGVYMFEVCLILVGIKLVIEVYFLGIGDKEDFVCLVFKGVFGFVVVVLLIDFGNRFCLIVNSVDVVEMKEDMFNLFVVSVFWKL